MMRFFVIAVIAMLVGCDSSSGAECDLRAYCCCSGDAVDPVQCGADGPACNSGKLYRGDDCQCLPDRNTPCCGPHIFDSGQLDSGQPDRGVDTSTD